MTQYTDCLNLVAVEADECPYPLMLSAIQRSAHEWCYRSCCWQPEMDPVDLVTDQAVYDIDAPGQSTVAHLLGASYAGTPLTAKTPEELDRLVPSWRTAVGTPQFYYRPTDSTVRLIRTPDFDETDGLLMRAAFAPSLDSNAVDDDVFNKYHEHIVAGALSRLMIMPGKKWSNPPLAQEYQRRFNYEASVARAVMLAANSSAELRVTPRPFA